MRNSADAQLIQLGWWPGDPNHPKAAFFGIAYPPEDGFGQGDVSPDPARWDANLGEWVLDWDDVRDAPDPRPSSRVRPLRLSSRLRRL